MSRGQPGATEARAAGAEEQRLKGSFWTFGTAGVAGVKSGAKAGEGSRVFLWSLNLTLSQMGATGGLKTAMRCWSDLRFQEILNLAACVGWTGGTHEKVRVVTVLQGAKEEGLSKAAAGGWRGRDGGQRRRHGCTSCAVAHSHPRAQEGLALALTLCCDHLEILSNLIFELVSYKRSPVRQWGRCVGRGDTNNVSPCGSWPPLCHVAFEMP